MEETPDRWAALLEGLKFQAALADRDDVPDQAFTADEQAVISQRIEEIKLRARENPELTAKQISGIEEKLDDLVAASGRVGKKDWRVMLYGYAFGMIANDIVPPDVVQGIITSVITGLGHIFGLGGVPPALPPQA